MKRIRQIFLIVLAIALVPAVSASAGAAADPAQFIKSMGEKAIDQLTGPNVTEAQRQVVRSEGAALAMTLFGKGPTPPDHESVPSAVFSQPEIGTVGLTEQRARACHGEVDVYRSTFRPLLHTLTGRDEMALLKLVVERASQRVVGCHLVCPHAGEIVQGFAVAIKMGATKAQLDATLGIHPTTAEEFVTLRTPVGI